MSPGCVCMYVCVCAYRNLVAMTTTSRQSVRVCVCGWVAGCVLWPCLNISAYFLSVCVGARVSAHTP